MRNSRPTRWDYSIRKKLELGNCESPAFSLCIPSFELTIDRYSPELYFVKVDVKACFDTIKQDKLLELVEESP